MSLSRPLIPWLGSVTMLALMTVRPASAATGTPPGTATSSPIDYPVLQIAAVVLVLCLLVGLVFRPGWRRPVAGIVIFLVFGSVALILEILGAFSDWTGQHATSPPLIVAGFAALLVGIVAAALIVRGGQARKPPIQ